MRLLTLEATDYYRSIGSPSDPHFAANLQALLEQTQHSLGYNRARDVMFQRFDRVGGSAPMRDLYSGAELAGVTSRPSAAAQGVNTEHIWPQSQGATAEAKSDLHHMGGTLQTINQYRWHLPFGAVVDAQDGAAPYRIAKEAGSTGFDAAGRLVFEPNDAAKGRIARSLMYVHTRYGLDDQQPPDYVDRAFTDSLPTLLAWNAAFLPDAQELRRNDLVQGAQGNRNPFVDHPEWAAQLLGDRSTTPAPLPRSEQLNEWVSFLKDPGGFSRRAEAAERAARQVGTKLAA